MTARWLLLAISILASSTAGTIASAQTPGKVGTAVEMLLPPPGPMIIPNDTGVSPRGSSRVIGASGCKISSTGECPPPPPGGELFIIKPAGPAPDAEYGYIVAIYYNMPDRSRHICTGTLLTADLVLTAGHCGCGVPNSYTVDFRRDTRSGIENRVTNVKGTPLLFDSRVCRTGDLRGGRDLALVRLIDKVERDIPPPLLPNLAPQKKTDRDNAINGRGYGYPSELVWDLRHRLRGRLTAVGYGYTESGQIGVRMQGQIPVLTADCTHRRFARLCAPFAEMILAEQSGRQLGADTCGGDSGGPVFLIENGKPTLVAVTSRAASGVQQDPVRHCGGGGVYTLIGRRSVHAWLKANGVPEEERKD